mgnify:CR=1 FL=1
MKAVILAAGEGARLGGWTSNRPKGMIPIGNRPILAYLVSGLFESGVTEINMVVGYYKNSVMSYFGDGNNFGGKINYYIQEEPKGTIDALSIGIENIGDEFIVVPGDNYVSASSFHSLLNFPKEVLLSGKAERWSKWGEIEIKKGQVSLTFDNPDAFGRIHFTGIMKISIETARKIVSVGGAHIGEALQQISGESNFEIINSDYWHNIVYPWDLISGNRLSLRDNLQLKKGKIEKNVTLKGPISIGNGSVISSGSYIVGPVSIGDNCDIGPNVVLGPSVSIGDNVVVESFAEIRDSIIMPNCEIGSFACLRGSVVGDSVMVGTHSVAVPSTRNIVYFDKEFFVSDRGAMIGDNCIISSRAILQGGSILLKGATIGEGEVYNADFQGVNI